MEGLRKKTLDILNIISIYISSFTVNQKLSIILLAITLVFIVINIIILHVEISNTGKLLWNPRSYKYIKIQPKENYLEILKPDGSNITSKEITVNGNKIILSYEIKNNSQPFFKLLDSKLDQIKVLEYACRKCNDIIYDKTKTYNKNIKFTIGLEEGKTIDPYAGAVTSNENIRTNNDFIQRVYEETTEKEFIIYYVGLIIHEMTHIFLAFNIDTYLDNETRYLENKSRYSENIAEYVRLVSGFQRDAWKVTKTSSPKPPSYGGHGSFFLLWLDLKYPGFIKQLVSEMYLNKEIETHKTVTGKTEEELFSEFNKELPFF